ncbi:MAG: FAD-dependent oxidoreductase, partial [Saprospiraceae bacterium]|nr:FAD-dependent oxidoreductase [Saprospiraceae bacterium]
MPKIIIIGAGIVGCSLADELTERGFNDVLVIEKGKLWKPGGSTSHAPGVVFQTNGSRTMAQFAQQTVDKLYSLRYHDEPCFLKVGSMEIATTPDRLADLHRRAGLAMSVGINARVITPDEALKLHPLLAREKLLGALYVPDDGIARAVIADEVMAERSMSRGAKFMSECEVIAIDQQNGKVTGVQTTKGSFTADIIVSCAGIWAPKIGAMVGMSKALQPLAHQLCYTAPMPELESYKGEAELPVLRHQGSDLYFRQRQQSLGVGWYGHRPLPINANDILPNEIAEIMPSQMAFTPEEWKGAMEHATEVIPSLKNAQMAESMNGLFSFTVDNFPLMGEWSGLKGFWVAEAIWVTHACGVARAMAEWIVNGHPSLAVHECDVNRFEAHQLGAQHIEERGNQNYVEVYDLLHPLQPMESPRPIRTTGFYQRQKELGAFFLEASGYERPQWYESNASLLNTYTCPPRDEWTSKFWSPIIGAESLAVRDGVGLFDITTLKRIEVIGKGALEFLERMTTGNLRKKPGAIT